MSNAEIKSWPYLTHRVGNTSEVAKFDSKKLAAERVEYLRTQRDKDASRRNWALGKKLPVKTVERIENAMHAITLDTLDLVAEAAGVEPWQLIAPLPQEVAEIAARLARIAGTRDGKRAIATCAQAAFQETAEEEQQAAPAAPSVLAPAPLATPAARAKGS
jgi:hypothetical protein